MSNDENMHVEIGKDYLIHIFNDTKKSYGKKYYGNDDNMMMEVLYDYENNSIIGVNCILSVFMNKGTIKLPNYKEIEINNDNKLNLGRLNAQEFFKIVYNREEANIIIKPADEITSYYTSGRIDFYYDNQMKLCDIRVRNLTREEYAVLYNDELDYGCYMEENKHKSK